jgi:hypothetical protein
MTYWEIGDTVALGCQFANSAGVPTNTTVVLTITLPDGTVATPAPVNASAGVYTAGYVPTQAGRHGVRWVGTGAVVSAFTDVFDVHSSSPPQLFSLAEGRSALKEPSAATADDEELRGYIIAATRVVEDVYGPVVPQTLTQTFDGGKRKLFADTSITTMVSVTESGAALVAGTDYTVDYDAGILSRGTFAGSLFMEPTYQEPAYFPAIWAFGIQNITIVYKAGVAPGSVIPEHVRKAGRIIMRALWQPDQQPYRPAFGTPDVEMSTTPSGLPIPHSALELLAGGSTEVGFS